MLFIRTQQPTSTWWEGMLPGKRSPIFYWAVSYFQSKWEQTYISCWRNVAHIYSYTYSPETYNEPPDWVWCPTRTSSSSVYQPVAILTYRPLLPQLWNRMKSQFFSTHAYLHSYGETWGVGSHLNYKTNITNVCLFSFYRNLVPYVMHTFDPRHGTTYHDIRTYTTRKWPNEKARMAQHAGKFFNTNFK